MKFLISVVLALLIGFASTVHAKDEILAKVGPYKLTKKEFEAQLESAPPQIKMILAHQPELKKALVERWAEISVLALGAKDAGLEKDPEVKRQIEEATKQILAQAYLEKKVLAKVKQVSDKELKSYYEKNKAKFQEPEEVRARHILIQVPQNASKEEVKKAYEKAQKIRERLLKGEDFAKLAKEYSDDPGTKDKGGELGFFSRGQMIKEFEDAAFSLKPGEISKPIRTPFGFHIIQVEEKKVPKEKPFEEVKAKVKEEYINQKQKEALQQALKELKAKYKVKIYTDKL
ncbi:PpiC-type peptidyl-prolyl cis-trans isomerase [Thermodesulfatator indicus DSM 15286]|uniref:peptidylprolyl isomerase n=1 Tax=Thermodesulfatator indicus (strain DSM 15286 / JCM 11887 / CIR29812) TaxID=667014 RepID=F8ADL9_THEID|nr:peptidylprolyl isomerase [Thermodesulfatator indicus]AEH44900.1 PpiC-type peptidyl-prolyl cis-trans isomerase [Thermodesulfatator indicus DSM 15286]